MSTDGLKSPLASTMVRKQLAWGCIYASTNLPDHFESSHTVIALGAFDGLHRGHTALIQTACADARRRGVACIAVTFDPDPADVLSGPQEGGNLLSIRDRCAGLLKLGVQEVYALSFTNDFAAKSPREFVEFLTTEVVRPLSIHVGKNFRFGYEGAGDIDDLASFGAALGFDVCPHELVMENGARVSATRIRALLHEGALDEANALLGRHHFVRGTVNHGRGEGRVFGFPTANVVCNKRDCMPCEGVYAGYVIQGTQAWPAAINVGAPPTFSSPVPAFLEANLLGFSGDLYNKEVVVSFAKWLRSSRPFDSLDELERVVMGNIEWVRSHLGETMLEVRS